MSISIFDPRVLDQVVRALPPNNLYLSSTFFPRRLPIEGTRADVDFFKGTRRIAPFVNPKGAAKGVAKQGYQTNRFETPMIRMKDTTTLEDLEVRVMGEQLQNSGMTRADRSIIRMAETMADFGSMIDRRIEWMCAKALFTGKIPVVGEGINDEIDFEFTNVASCGSTAGYGVVWSTSATAKPLADLEKAQLACTQKGYRKPDICLMARDAFNEFIACASLKDVVNSLNSQIAIMAPQVLPSGMTYCGVIRSLNLSIYVYDEWFMDDTDNTEKPMVPDGQVLLISSTAGFTIYFGEMAVADPNQNGGIRSVIGERTPETWIQEDPVARFLAMQSRPLPAPVQVDSWFVLTV
jgi:hypothetical protein